MKSRLRCAVLLLLTCTAAVALGADIVPSLELRTGSNNACETAVGKAIPFSGLFYNPGASTAARIELTLSVSGEIVGSIFETVVTFTPTPADLEMGFSPSTYSVPPHTPLTVQATAYPNESGLAPPTYSSTLIFDCTTGEVLSIVNKALANRSGTIDRSFGNQGTVITDYGIEPGGYGSAIASIRQPDGKVLVVGGSDSVPAILRADAAGNLDQSWGTGGRVLLGVDGTPATATALALDPKGNVYVGVETQVAWAILKLDSTGKPVSSFGIGGTKLMPLSFDLPTTPQSVAVDPAGNLIVAGPAPQQSAMAITKLDQSGEVVKAFGQGGVVYFGFGVPSLSPCNKMLAVDSAGAIYATMTEAGNLLDFAVFKFDTDGRPASAFGTAGKALIDAGGSWDYSCSLTLDSKGNVYVLGRVLYPPPSQYLDKESFGVIKLDSSGRLVNGFGTGGRTVVNVGFQSGVAPTADVAANIFVDVQQNVFLAGASSIDGGRNFVVLKLDHKGSLAPGFGTGGVQRINVGAPVTAPSGIDVDASGNVFVGGAALVQRDGTYDFVVAKVDASGALVQNFGVGGVAAFSPGSVHSGGSPLLALDAAGNVFVGGSAFAVQKLDSRGRPVEQFGTGSKAIYELPVGATGWAAGIAVDAGGDTFLGGGVADPFGAFAAIKLGADGRPVASYGTNGGVLVDDDDPALDGQSGGAMRDAMGNLFILLETIDLASARIAKLDPNGHVDAAFGNGGIAEVPLPFPRGLALDSNGNLYIAAIGSSSVGSNAVVAKVTAAGALDSRFGTNGLVSFHVDTAGLAHQTLPTSITVDSGDSVYVGGTALGASTGVFVAKLNSDGSFAPFGDGGVRAVDTSLAFGVTSPAIAVDTHHRVLMAAGTEERAVVLALDEAGNLSQTFGRAGMAAIGPFAWPRAIALDGYGRAVIVGTTTTPASSSSMTTRMFVSEPTKLSIRAINGGQSPSTGTPFDAVISVQDEDGAHHVVTQDTTVTLSRSAGNGQLGGSTACSIPSGSDTCTISGLIYSVADTGVMLKAIATGGDPLASAISAPFSVVGPTSVNFALAANGGVATASSSYSSRDYPVASVNDNERAGKNWGNGGGWNDNTINAYPDWVQISFNGNKTIDHVVIYTLQDNYTNPVEPTDAQTFTLYGVTAFNVQTWNGRSWVTQGTVTGNNLVKRRINFATVTTSRIRINISNALASFSRITEIEAWGTSTAGPPPSTTTLISSQNPSTVGVGLTFTATVVGTTPAGTANFTSDGVAIAGCTGVALLGSGNNGTAICTTTALTAGTHSIAVAYSGDGANGPSSSDALSQVISAVGGSINVALSSNGAVASASSVFGSLFPVAAINNNDRTGRNWGSGGGWNDGTSDHFPDWVQITFNGTKTIDRIVLYTLQDDFANPIEPTDAQTFSLYGVTGFTVQAKQGLKTKTVATVTGNNLVKRTVTFPPVETTQIRININSALASFSRIVEVEAWGK